MATDYIHELAVSVVLETVDTSASITEVMVSSVHEQVGPTIKEMIVSVVFEEPNDEPPPTKKRISPVVMFY